MSKKEKDCPLSVSDWINVLENYESHITSKTMPILQILIAIFAIFVSVIFLAELRDNVIKNLFAGNITIAMSYIYILMIILVFICLIGILIIIFVIMYIKDLKSADEILKKIVYGEDDSNVIRDEWREKIEKPKERKKMLNRKELKLMFKHSLPVIGLIAVIVFFAAIGLYLIRENQKVIYSLILQIIGVLFLSLWSLLERSTNAMKIIANLFNKIIKLEGNPWRNFDKTCRTTGLGFVMAGLIIELVLYL